MKNRQPKLHNYELGLPGEKLRRNMLLSARVGAAGLILAGMAYNLDVAITQAIEPVRPHTVDAYDKTESCKDARFVVIYLDSTGKQVGQWLAANNEQIIKARGGTQWVTHFGSQKDVPGFTKMLDDKLAECIDEPGEKKPVVLNSMSLGGKYAQWVINQGLSNGEVIANVMEATPPDPEAIKDMSAGGFVRASRGQSIPMGDGLVFFNGTVPEFKEKGIGWIFNAKSWENVIDSARRTHADTLSWQARANGESWPIPSNPSDNTTPIYYIGDPSDGLVDNALAIGQLKLLTRAEVHDYWVQSSTKPGSISHAEGWLRERRYAYNPAYNQIYDKISTQLHARHLPPNPTQNDSQRIA